MEQTILGDSDEYLHIFKTLTKVDTRTQTAFQDTTACRSYDTKWGHQWKDVVDGIA